MKGFRLFAFFHKNVNPVSVLDIRYIDIDMTDIDELKNKEATMTNTATLPATSTATWNIDPAHSMAEFRVKHMMIANVKGQFSKVSGALFLDESDLANSRVEATIEAASIHTRDEQRDAHLKSPDFFDVEKFPTLHFKSKSISIVRDGELAVEGDLTIRGVTHKVHFAVEGPTPPAQDPWGNTRVAVSATTKINRKDFGLTWNTALETGGILVGDEVTITLEVEFVKA
jgi:polyisoprenoid-binding protein YceI